MKSALVLLLFLCGSLRAFAQNPDTLLIVVTENDTPATLAAQYLGSAEAARELLQYNQIADPTRVPPGTQLIVPMQVRTRALQSIQQAENAISAAESEHAAQYAPVEFERAKQQYQSAVKFRRDLDYSRAAGMAQLCVQTCDHAVNRARTNALIQQDAELLSTHGQVHISLDGETWMNAEKGALLPVKTKLRTGEASRAELRMADGSLVTLTASTELSLEQLLLDRRNGLRRSELNVILGEILGEITPRERDESRFEIQSGNSTLGIRGTDIRFAFAPEERSTTVSVLSGTGAVTAAGRSVDLDAGTGTYVRGSRPPAPPQRLLPPPDLGSNVPDGTVTPLQRFLLTWAPVSARELGEYLLEIAHDPEFNRPVLSARSRVPQVDTGVLPEGRYFWRVASADTHGIIGTFSAARSFSIAKKLDVVLTPLTRVWQVEKRAVVSAGNAFRIGPKQSPSSAVAYQYRLNDGDFVTGNEVRLTRSGEFRLDVRAIAADGQPGPVLSQTFVADVDAPELTVHRKLTSTESETWVDVELVAADANGVQRIEFRAANGPWFLYSTPFRLGLEQPVQLEVRATDLFGNQSDIRRIQLDRSAP